MKGTFIDARQACNQALQLSPRAQLQNLSTDGTRASYIALCYQSRHKLLYICYRCIQQLDEPARKAYDSMQTG